MTATADLLVVAPSDAPRFALTPHTEMLLTAFDHEFVRWLAAVKPALRHNCVRLDPIDESLTRWVAHRLAWCPDRQRDIAYRTVLTTPPGRPRWLTLT